MSTTQSSNSQAPQILERAKVYHSIKSRLQRQLGRRWPVGTRLPPIKELAKQLKTGQTNTHRAVKELARAGLLVSRSGQGTFVTERAGAGTAVASGTAGGADGGDAAVADVIIRPPAGSLTGMTVKVLTAMSEPDQFIRRSMDAFGNILRGDGASVVHATYAYQQAEPLAAHREADGLLVINPAGAPMQCGPKQVLCVINTAIETAIAMATGYDVVSADSEQGGFVAGQHLRRAGVKVACFIGCPPYDGVEGSYDRTSGTRLHGFEQGFGEAIPPERRLYCKSYQTTIGATMVPIFLKMNPRPDGIFAASDEIALGFMHGAIAHGLEAGNDYQIVGFDSQQRGRDLPTGPLTSIEVPSVEMGRWSAMLLAERLLDQQHPVRRISLGCKLFQGATTRSK